MTAAADAAAGLPKSLFNSAAAAPDDDDGADFWSERAAAAAATPAPPSPSLRCQCHVGGISALVLPSDGRTEGRTDGGDFRTVGGGGGGVERERERAKWALARFRIAVAGRVWFPLALSLFPAATNGESGDGSTNFAWCFS